VRSFASVRGHPIHPALITFPFAFLTGAFVAHAAAVVLERPTLWTTGGYLTIAGIGMGLVAAIPGLLDYLRTVPPRSSAKKRATKHMLAMIAVLAAFAVSLAFRSSSNPIGPTLVLLIQGTATLLLSAGAWLGGTLVSRNQIGVDHRYANAGQWSETRFTGPSAGSIVAARHDELKANQMKLLHVNGHRIVLARTEDGYVAFDDRCTHRGGSLAGGVMICGVVQCPWHGSQFEASTGKVKAGPATQPIVTYGVEDNGREVVMRIAPVVAAARASAREESAPGPLAR
jgi:nitrite reductase/ring-hydroxylating ferredoxin subunit/uncharacterized membrane protein